MSDSILLQLRHWVASRRATFLGSFEVEIETFVGDGDSGLRIDLFGNDVAGRMTLWANGNLDLDVLAGDLGEQVFFEHRRANSLQEMVEALTTLVARCELIHNARAKAALTLEKER